MKRNNLIGILVLLILACGSNAARPTEEELEVILQFFEFELEDICTLKSNAKWEFLNGHKFDLTELYELELREAELYKNETKSLQEFFGETFINKRLQRLMDIFFYPGAPLIGIAELKEYKEYSVKLEEINRKMTIGCKKGDSEGHISEPEDCEPKNARMVNEMLAKEKNEKKLRKLWSEWFEELRVQNQKTKFDFIQHLSILDLEAEQNEEDDLSDYWLKQADIKDLDYHKISQLWKEIIPLYQKIRKYIAGKMSENYGNKIFIDNKVFPMHLLGSLKSVDWVVAAEKLGVFSGSLSYEYLKSKLSGMKMEDVYRMADNLTSQAKIGDLPPEFYNNSRFDVKSSLCKEKLFDYCTRKNSYRALSCFQEDVSITRFMNVHEDVANLKHLIIAGKETENEENGFLFVEGPRDSVIYEAISGLFSLIAVKPKNLRKQKLLPETPLFDEEIWSLMVSALHTIPSLPYYLAADLWRINALKELDAIIGESTYGPSTISYISTTPVLDSTTDEVASEIVKRDVSRSNGSEASIETSDEETENVREAENVSEMIQSVRAPHVTQATLIHPKIYDFENLTMDWWKYREQLQGVGNLDEKFYPDFLMDEKIIWNKPYVSKFLGRILQFQLLEYFRKENVTTNSMKIQSLLNVGKSKPYQEILSELFDITEISTKPLLMYFKPLEEFIDAGMNFQSKTSDSKDFSLFSQSFSMNSPTTENEEIQKSSNTLVFTLLIVTVLGIVLVSVFVALKRYRTKRRAKAKRKRQNAILN